METEAAQKAKIIEKAFDDKKAQDITLMNIGSLTSLAEFFVICTCTSVTQVRACVDEAEEKMTEAGFKPHHKEGYSGGSWVLIDFGDVIAHVMTREAREFYDIERLWSDND